GGACGPRRSTSRRRSPPPDLDPAGGSSGIDSLSAYFSGGVLRGFSSGTMGSSLSFRLLWPYGAALRPTGPALRPTGPAPAPSEPELWLPEPALRPSPCSPRPVVSSAPCLVAP